MTREKLLSLLKEKRNISQIDLTKENIEGMKCNLLHFGKNHTLIKENDLAKSIYFVINGEVMTSVNDQPNVYHEREFFGLDALEKEGRRNYKAITVTNSMILELIVHEDKKHSAFDEIAPLSMNQVAAESITNMPDIQNLALIREFKTAVEKTVYSDVIIVFVNTKMATLSIARNFLEYLTEIISAGNKKIIVDLRTCRIIDSTFLGALVKGLKSIQDIKGEIVLIYNRDYSSTIFMITYMDKIFKTYANLEEAINYFGKK